MLLAQNYNTSLIAAGNFMTGDQNGATLAGDPYANIKALFDVQPQAGGFSGTTSVAITSAGTGFDGVGGYAANEAIHTYANAAGVGWLAFTDAVRRSVPVRTFDGLDDPPPGFVQADLVAHSGPVAKGSFVQILVLTDIATGWTECAPLLVREQRLLHRPLWVSGAAADPRPRRLAQRGRSRSHCLDRHQHLPQLQLQFPAAHTLRPLNSFEKRSINTAIGLDEAGIKRRSWRDDDALRQPDRQAGGGQGRRSGADRLGPSCGTPPNRIHRARCDGSAHAGVVDVLDCKIELG